MAASSVGKKSGYGACADVPPTRVINEQPKASSADEDAVHKTSAFAQAMIWTGCSEMNTRKKALVCAEITCWSAIIGAEGVGIYAVAKGLTSHGVIFPLVLGPLAAICVRWGPAPSSEGGLI